jgi:UDPglucose 6-dehydrogenase
VIVKQKPSIGVIGGGFVGGTFADGYKHYTDVKLYDVNPRRASHSYEEVVEQDVLVVALPTPMKSDGSVDVSILDGAFEKLNQTCPGGLGGQKPTILRSTVPPKHLSRISSTSKNLEFYYVPEFLTERSAALDFQQSNRIIVGTKHGLSEPIRIQDRLLANLFDLRFPEVPIKWVTYTEASLVKYLTNVFFCSKIAMLNEFAQVCEGHGLDFNAVFAKVMLDQRIGRSHFQVPGHDGKLGFGGHCFPKDLNGYMEIAKDVGVLTTVSEAVWKKNLEVRPEQDWKQDVGRAVSKEDDEGRD